MKVKILWDSAQSMGFMLHLLNSHKKYQLKYSDFGRNIGNLRETQTLWLSCTCSSMPSLLCASWMRRGCRAGVTCHSFSTGTWGGAHFPHLHCTQCSLFELAHTEVLGLGGLADTILGRSVAWIWDALPILECPGLWEEERTLRFCSR